MHELDPSIKQKFLNEMSLVAEAVDNAFKPEKMNYELLGNSYEHMHWHLFPRRSSDPEAHTAIWAIPKEQRSYEPTHKELTDMKSLLLKELDRLS